MLCGDHPSQERLMSNMLGSSGDTEDKQPLAEDALCTASSGESLLITAGWK